MFRKTKTPDLATQQELIGVLTAISIVAKRLAEKLASLEDRIGSGVDSDERT